MNTFCNENAMKMYYIYEEKIPYISQGIRKGSLLVDLSKFFGNYAALYNVFFFRIMGADPNNYAILQLCIIPEALHIHP